MTVEVLVATVDRSDMELYHTMNIRGSALIANQCGQWQFRQQRLPAGTVRMLSSDTRGIGINRNLALMESDADIVLFADDDIVYNDDALTGVAEAFRQLPDADVILFGMDMTRDGEVYERRRHPLKRLRLHNSLKFGAARMAVRRSALRKHNIWFSTLFGGGCTYGSGEDSLFLRQCLRCGLKVYSHPHVLGRCAKDRSSWFTGYNEKFMFDKGAWVACAFPGTKHLMKWYFLWRFFGRSQLSPRQMLRWMNRGIRAYKTQTPYTQE